MEADPIDEKSKISKSQVDIHPDAAVVSKAILKGNITIGPGTIVHPQAFIDAGDGSIVFGANNIVEETACIRNLRPQHDLKIGDDNLFEIGSICQAIEIGDNNIFGIQSVVGPEVKVTNGCRIGARCKLLTEEELPPLTVLHLEHNQRKIACDKPISLKSQAEFLKKLLPKYSEIIRNRKDGGDL